MRVAYTFSRTPARHAARLPQRVGDQRGPLSQALTLGAVLPALAVLLLALTAPFAGLATAVAGAVVAILSRDSRARSLSAALADRYRTARAG